MEQSFFKRRCRRATKDANAILHIGPRGSVVIGAITTIAAIVLLWLFGSEDALRDEAVAKTGLLLIVLAYPVVWLWRFFAAPKLMLIDSEQTSAHLREQLETRRAVLVVSYGKHSPHIYARFGKRGIASHRVQIRNDGMAEAQGVKVWLRRMEPKPRAASIRRDFPYRVPPVGTEWDSAGKVIDIQEVSISPNDSELFEITRVSTSAAPKEGTHFVLQGLDTKPLGRWFSWPIHLDEQWILYYEATAFNARAARFRIVVVVSENLVNLTYQEGWIDEN